MSSIDSTNARVNSSNSSSNVSSASEEAIIIASDDLIVVTVWSLILVYALVANCIVVAGILRNVSMRRATSYWFIISLAVCDLIMILISLCHIIPATYWHGAFLERLSRRNIIALFFYDVFWYTGVLKLGFMAVNRFASIIYPMEYKRLFSRANTLWMIAGLYLIGLGVSVPTLFSCCHTIYDHNWWVTMYEPMDTWYSFVDLAVNTVSVLLMVLCYAAIVWKVHLNQKSLARYKHANTKSVSHSVVAKTTNGSNNKKLEVECTTAADGNRRPSIIRSASSPNPTLAQMSANAPPPQKRPHMSRREFRLFVQFFVVSLIFLLTWSTWQWLPRIKFPSIRITKWVYFLLTTFFFLNNSVNPTVYLLFNSTLRQEVATMFFGARTHAAARQQDTPSKTSRAPNAMVSTSVNRNNRVTMGATSASSSEENPSNQTCSSRRGTTAARRQSRFRFLTLPTPFRRNISLNSIRNNSISSNKATNSSRTPAAVSTGTDSTSPHTQMAEQQTFLGQSSASPTSVVVYRRKTTSKQNDLDVNSQVVVIVTNEDKTPTPDKEPDEDEDNDSSIICLSSTL